MFGDITQAHTYALLTHHLKLSKPSAIDRLNYINMFAFHYTF